jgi:hypothetical protein
MKKPRTTLRLSRRKSTESRRVVDPNPLEFWAKISLHKETSYIAI